MLGSSCSLPPVAARAPPGSKMGPGLCKVRRPLAIIQSGTFVVICLLRTKMTEFSARPHAQLNTGSGSVSAPVGSGTGA
jgi:hypothetical protein